VLERPLVVGVDERIQHALDLAYRYLSRRDRTEAEVRKHLAGKDVDAVTVEESMRELQHSGYLDDARFARLFAQDKRELEQWGSERIKRGLLGRGVEGELVDAVLEQQGAESDLDRALALLRRRFPSPPRDRRERDRALGILLRKGYDPEVALDALASYAREPDPGQR
jgi:regulatory protein